MILQNFRIEDEAHGYRLHISGYTGTAGDGMLHHSLNDKKFSTRDRDNDNHSKNCAQLYEGGWWAGK